MSDICPRCGLPKEICVCSVLDKEVDNKIKVYAKKAKFHKNVTVIEGIPEKELDNASKILKRVLACGGTSKDGIIELQGVHVDLVKKVLIEKLGYNASNIDVV
ncbi:MAG: stress response translation initiation inhibitor YciH [Candidatus Micrarchaeaceae archaeon]